MMIIRVGSVGLIDNREKQDILVVGAAVSACDRTTKWKHFDDKHNAVQTYCATARRLNYTENDWTLQSVLTSEGTEQEQRFLKNLWQQVRKPTHTEQTARVDLHADDNKWRGNGDGQLEIRRADCELKSDVQIGSSSAMRTGRNKGTKVSGCTLNKGN